MKSLKELEIANTRVTNEGLTMLLGLKPLTHLNVGFTGINDAALKKLVLGLPNLTQIDVGYTRISATAKNELKKLRPLLVIDGP